MAFGWLPPFLKRVKTGSGHGQTARPFVSHAHRGHSILSPGFSGVSTILPSSTLSPAGTPSIRKPPLIPARARIL